MEWQCVAACPAFVAGRLLIALDSSVDFLEKPMPRSATKSPIPMAFLDHVVIMSDSETHGELLSSPFLRHSFGRFKVKTATSSLAQTYTSAGLAGVSTLLEFFDVAAPPLPDLIGALVLSFPVPGSLAVVRAKLEEALDAEVPYELVRRTVQEGQEPLPWYHLARPDFGAGSPFILMLAEGAPEYFSQQLGATLGAAGEMHRKAYLEAALGEDHGPDRHLGDVSEVSLNLSPRRAEILHRCLEALDYVASPQGEPRTFCGPDVTIRVTCDGGSPEGVAAVRTTLQHPLPAPGRWSFGATSVLEAVDDRHALWHFTPPSQAGSGEG